MEDITDADYAQTKRVYKYNTLLLPYVFENFWNIFLEIYALDPAQCLSVPWLAWWAALKKTKIKLDVLTDIDILVMVEKGSRGEYVMLFIDGWKLIRNTQNIISYLKY